LVVGYSRALELIITGKRIDAQEAYRIGLVSEVMPLPQLMPRARELARSICELPQGSIRADKETVIRCVGRTVEERTFIETEAILTMFIAVTSIRKARGLFWRNASRNGKATVSKSMLKSLEEGIVSRPRIGTREFWEESEALQSLKLRQRMQTW